MAGRHSERRRRNLALTTWTLAVVLGLVAGLIVVRRLAPGGSGLEPAEASGVVPVPGADTNADSETARVLLPAGTPLQASGRPGDNAASADMHLRIPTLALDSLVVEGVDLGSLVAGVGHWPGTAQPGAAGNMVLAGHRTTHGAPFRRLDELELGDEAIIGQEGASVTYRVTETEIVSPNEVEVARPTANATATLFACHPPGSARQRIVVRLESSG